MGALTLYYGPLTLEIVLLHRILEDHRGLCVLTLFYILSRTILLAIYDGGGFPDSAHYWDYAERILSEGWTLLSAPVEHDVFDVTLFRAPGYPLLLALSISIFADHAAHAVMLLQSATIFTAALFLYRASDALGLPRWLSLSTIFGYWTSFSFAYEVSILTDPLISASWLTIVALSLHAWATRSTLSARTLVLLFLCFLVLISFRTNGFHLALFTAPCLLLGFWVTKGVRRWVGLALVILPILLVQSSIGLWNQSRTGVWFQSAGARTVALQATFGMARLGPVEFEGGTQTEQAIKDIARDYSWPEVLQITDQLVTKQGVPAWIAASEAVELYLRTLHNHPDLFWRMWLRNFQEKFALSLINPAFGVTEGHHLRTGDRFIPGYSKIMKGETSASVPAYLHWVYAGSYSVFAFGSVLLFVFALLGTPLWIATQVFGNREKSSRLAYGVLALWCSALAVPVYYQAIYVELRYLTMTAPLFTLLGLLVAWRIVSTTQRAFNKDLRPRPKPGEP